MDRGHTTTQKKSLYSGTVVQMKNITLQQPRKYHKQCHIIVVSKRLGASLLACKSLNDIFQI